ncbi:MAG: arylsulfatase [Candidatus Sumerlaeaceae bacterium]
MAISLGGSSKYSTALLTSLAIIAHFSMPSRSAMAAPNIVFILADDLGYADLGCYGQSKIRTPRIDQLAREGMRFTHHYAGNAVCAPSRCVLMTGLHPGHAVVRDNREMKPEGQFPLPANTVTLAGLLKKRGYVTGAFGKWGLGGPGSSGEPLKQGFDRFYGYNCQAKAHNYYPQYLWDDNTTVALDNPLIPQKARLPETADPSSSASYGRYVGKQYSPDLIAEQARRFVREHKHEPFFLYVPTTVPHLSLQVPEDSLAEYAGMWPDPPYTGNRSYLPHFTPRAAYAAMITRMDTEIGRLLDLLEELRILENTIVIFTSDNGPTYKRLGGSDSDFFESAGPLRGLKGSLYEGGVRVPLIVRWPGHVRAGSTCDLVTGFEDWLPTLVELTGAGDKPAKLDGISFAPALAGAKQPDRPFLYREFPAYTGQQSVRVGDWKLIRHNLGARNLSSTSPTLELFNLKDDIVEQHDVAAEHGDQVAKLSAVLKQQHQASINFPIASLDGE